MPGIVVVGAGLAGARCASALRDKGFTGALDLVGAEEHPPYDRPPLSKNVLSGAQEPRLLHSAEELEAMGVDWHRATRARSLDTQSRRLELSTGDTLTYDQLVIATGADARPFPRTVTLSGVVTLRTLDDSMAIKTAAESARATVVMGGGVLGCEVAATLAHSVPSVTLVEPQATLLARTLGDSQLARAVAALHHDAGVSLRLGIGVRSLVGDGHVEQVLLDDGTTLPADLLVVALGAQPATSWLEDSKVRLHDGVVCDAYLRTSAERVFAVGDVARIVDVTAGHNERREHWTSATEQAEVVAHNLLAAEGELMPYASLPYVWSDQHGRKIQVLGRPANGDTEKVIAHDPATGKMLSVFGRDGLLCGAAAISMAGRLMKLRRLFDEPVSLNDAVQVATG